VEIRTSHRERRSPKARGRGATRRKWLLGLACLVLASGWAAAAGSEKGMGEYQVKAAVVFNFTKFTDWPSNAFASATAPIVIGIVGEDPFGSTLDDLVRGEAVRERKLVVKRLRAGEDLQSCHVLFISRSEKERLSGVLRQLKGHPVLSVGDMNDFAEQGGMVSLKLAKENVKLEINQAAAEQAGLQISAKVLKIARIVNSNN
jgi:hypothetical protein